MLAACPPVQIAVPADRLGNNNDEGEVRFVAVMEELLSSCRLDQDDIEVEISFTLSAERGPGLNNDLVPLTYFLATVDPNREIVDKQILDIQFDFGQDKALAALRETVTLRLPASTEASGANYSLYLGFQPDQQPVQKDAKVPRPAVPAAAENAASEAAPARTATAATERSVRAPSTAARPSLNGALTGSAKLVEDGGLEIVFALNSSVFPEGADDQLRAFMETLDKSKRYVLRIKTSVDDAARVSGASQDETARYNTWLAERRSKRVEAWLQENGDGLEFTLESALIQNDRSRRVRIEPDLLG